MNKWSGWKEDNTSYQQLWLKIKSLAGSLTIAKGWPEGRNTLGSTAGALQPLETWRLLASRPAAQLPHGHWLVRQGSLKGWRDHSFPRGPPFYLWLFFWSWQQARWLMRCLCDADPCLVGLILRLTTHFVQPSEQAWDVGGFLLTASAGVEPAA